jgi:hypothetical protein
MAGVGQKIAQGVQSRRNGEEFFRDPVGSSWDRLGIEGHDRDLCADRSS